MRPKLPGIKSVLAVLAAVEQAFFSLLDGIPPTAPALLFYTIAPYLFYAVHQHGIPTGLDVIARYLGVAWEVVLLPFPVCLWLLFSWRPALQIAAHAPMLLYALGVLVGTSDGTLAENGLLAALYVTVGGMGGMIGIRAIYRFNQLAVEVARLKRNGNGRQQSVEYRAQGAGE